jgi:hypothetical protein
MIRRAVLLVALSACGLAPLHAKDPEATKLRGFDVYFHLIDQERKQRMLPSLLQQFDIVEQVGVPEEVLGFFRSVPILIDPSVTSGKGHAQMVNGRPVVRLLPTELPRDRPILLHELLHAYHFEKLGRTPAIRAAYQQARNGIYPKKYANAHFLENPKEYFAVIASIFLYGKKIDQPPYNCGISAKQQPEFIAFLAEQFGPHPCN